jgi:DNA-binding MarR family transcriptional regulator
MKNERTLQTSILYHIHRISARGRNVMTKALRPWGITAEQLILLKSAYENEGLTQRHLAQESLKDAPNTTRLIDKLESAGLLVRKQDMRDRRSYRIFTTEKGRRLVERINPVMQRAVDHMTTNLAKDEHDQLVALLVRLYDNVVEAEDKFLNELTSFATSSEEV